MTTTNAYIKAALDAYDGNIRNTARQLNISPMKLRKILITAGAFENGVSREIHNLLKRVKYRRNLRVSSDV